MGSGQPNDNTHFATLEDLRIATTPTGNNYYNLHDGDKITLYKDDNSLTATLDMGNETSGVANVTVISNDLSQQRTITPATADDFPIFTMNVPNDRGSNIKMDSIVIKDVTSSTGAIYAWWHNNLNITNSKFINNKNTNVGSDVGGAIYYWDALEAHITDTDFIGNYTSASGGAMLIWNSSSNRSDTTNVTLEVTDGKTMTFKDNYEKVTNMNDPATGKRNSINFTGTQGKHINLNIITAANATLDMQDPFATNAASSGNSPYTVDIKKTGAGTWRLGGISRVEGSGGTQVLINSGTLELTDSAQLLTIGTNDSFTVRREAEVLLRGNNAIEGTKVTFDPGAYLTFDMDFYKTNAKSSPMLLLSGTTLAIEGSTISVDNLPTDPLSRNGEYLLIRGDSPLKAGNFNLFIGSEKVDISGDISERFGYSLGNTVRSEELVLRIQNKENAIIKWENNIDEKYRERWSTAGMNWTLPYRNNKKDGFVPGDTVVFDTSGSQTVMVVKDTQRGNVLIAPVADGGYNFYKNNGIGMHVGGEADWKFVGDVIVDEYITGNTVNEAKKAALYYDGSGSLRMENNAANEFHGNVIHAGTGTIYVSQLDRFGEGKAFEFIKNNGTDGGQVVFTATADVSNKQTFDRQFKVSAGGNGYVKNDTDETLTLTPATGDIAADIDGGKLTFQGKSRDTFLVSGSKDTNAAINVKNGGTFNATSVTFDGRSKNDSYVVKATSSDVILDDVSITGNNSQTGLLIADNSNLTIKDSDITGNTAASVIAFVTSSGSSTLSLTAGDGKELNISGNTVKAGVALLASSGGTAQVNLNAEGTGVVNILNPFAGEVVDASGSIEINKTGTGTVNLGGTNTFTNDSSGTLLLNVAEGKLALEKDAAVTLPNGGVTVASDAALLSSGGNKITAGTFTLNADSTLAFDLAGQTGETVNPVLLDVAANVPNLTVNVNIDLVNLNLPRLEENDKKTFNLAHFNNNFAETNLNQMTLFYNGIDMRLLRENFAELTYDKSGNNILAVDVTAPVNGLTRWNNGSSTKVWNQVAPNWTGTNRAEGDLIDTTQFLDGDAVEFLGGTGAQTISITSNGVRISDQPRAAGNTADTNPIPGMTVKNEIDQDYIFSGGSINGDGSLVKKGSGNLTFEQSNGFTGSTTIENGKIIAKKTDSLGTEGGVSIAQNGTLDFSITENNSGDFTQTITGSGTILKTENGNVVLTEASPNFTGKVNIQKGELGIADIKGVGTAGVSTGDNNSSGTFAFAGAKGTFTNKITGEGKVRVGNTASASAVVNADVILSGINTYSGGTTVDRDSKLTISQFENTGSGDITVNGTLDLQFADNQTVQNRSIAGNGLIEKNLDGQLDFEEATDFSGTFRLNDGTILLSDRNGLQNATLDYKGGDVDFETNNAIFLGGLSGGTNAGGDRLGIVLENNDGRKITLTVGNNNTNQEYTGELSGYGSFVKTGTV
ncbi:hypothetical protein FACS18942_06490 [Planctomycetales bacterium]|nr:hypothetical protein FACS18942_06490 [Planctomycetales bacterium]